MNLMLIGANDLPPEDHPTLTIPLTMSELVPGDHAVIDRLNGSSAKIRQRLLEMGLTRGTPIRLIRFAPLGDPIEIAVRGYRLSLRREEASSIIVSRR